MIVLVAVGIAVAVFGALVLLRFPDRPGGKIAWQDFEVSSVGAGLPLIALGVALVAVAGFRGGNGGGESPAAEASEATTLAGTTTGATGTAAEDDCTAAYLADIPEQRKETVAVGAIDTKVIAGGEPLAGPIGLGLTDRRAPVGAVRLDFDPDGPTFYVEGIVDATCAELSQEAHESMAGDVDGDDTTWIQYEEVCIDFGPQTYALQIGAGADVSVSFGRAGCEAS